MILGMVSLFTIMYGEGIPEGAEEIIDEITEVQSSFHIEIPL
ncbi:MAG: hypothetical protein WAQ29_11380 [Nitrososphaeraceae archaeon]